MKYLSLNGIARRKTTSINETKNESVKYIGGLQTEKHGYNGRLRFEVVLNGKRREFRTESQCVKDARKFVVNGVPGNIGCYILNTNWFSNFDLFKNLFLSSLKREKVVCKIRSQILQKINSKLVYKINSTLR